MPIALYYTIALDNNTLKHLLRSNNHSSSFFQTVFFCPKNPSHTFWSSVKHQKIRFFNLGNLMIYKTLYIRSCQSSSFSAKKIDEAYLIEFMQRGFCKRQGTKERGLALVVSCHGRPGVKNGALSMPYYSLH